MRVARTSTPSSRKRLKIRSSDSSDLPAPNTTSGNPQRRCRSRSSCASPMSAIAPCARRCTKSATDSSPRSSSFARVVRFCLIHCKTYRNAEHARMRVTWCCQAAFKTYRRHDSGLQQGNSCKRVHRPLCAGPWPISLAVRTTAAARITGGSRRPTRLKLADAGISHTRVNQLEVGPRWKLDDKGNNFVGDVVTAVQRYKRQSR